MNIGVLALQGAFIEHEKVLDKLGVDYTELRQKSDLDTKLDGIILPGGESTVQGKLLRELDMFENIKEQIEDNILKPNQVIASENEMCRHYDVSRVTVRKAIDELCAEGILYRIKGKGCFVRELKDQKRSHIYSFTEAVKNEGKTPSKKQLSLKTMNADAYLAEKLQITEGDEVYEIRSLYYADGVPYSLNTAVLPAERFPKLDFFDFNNRSLYEVLGSFFHTEMYRVRQTLEAVTADKEIAQMLERKESQPLLKIKAVSYSLEENREIPVEYYEAYILTEIQNYYVEKFTV